EMDLDVVPVGEVTDDGAVALPVIRLEGIQRLVREYHSETEGILRPVALENRDLCLRPRLLHQTGEIQPAWTATDDVNFHWISSVAQMAPGPVVPGPRQVAHRLPADLGIRKPTNPTGLAAPEWRP